jgi:hypothetical protein
MIWTSELGAWATRLVELAEVPSPLPWPRAWAILARAETRSEQEWARRLLWQYRLWSWVRGLGSDPRTCWNCGGRIDLDGPLDPRSRFCLTRCRKRAHRAKHASKPTPFEELLSRAEHQLALCEREIRDAERWLDRAYARRLRPPPPDLDRYENLPPLPSRCGSVCGVGVGCTHTAGGYCLYATRPESAPPMADEGPRLREVT